MAPNLLDVLLALVVLVAAGSGWRRGALAQVTALVGAVGGLLLGAMYAPTLAERFVDDAGLGLAALTLLGLLLSMVVGQAVGATLGSRLRAVAAGIGAAPADRVAGLVVSAGGVLLAAWLLGAALVQGPSSAVAEQVQGSEVLTRLDDALPEPPDVVGRVGSYLDRQGFPQVTTGLNAPVGPPVETPADEDVAAAVEAGEEATVRVESRGCGATSQGSGFVIEPGYIVTNAHVVAGGDALVVRGRGGTTDAVPVGYDADQDVAVLRAEGLDAPALAWADQPSDRETSGATLGYGGGAPHLIMRPATVSTRASVIGRDIYGQDRVSREVLTLTADVERGDSGGPFVTTDGQVGGVVFAASTSEPGHGYALTAESVRDEIAAAIDGNATVETGDCRFGSLLGPDGAPIG